MKRCVDMEQIRKAVRASKQKRMQMKRDAEKYSLVQMVVVGEIGKFADMGGDPYGLIVCLHRLWAHPEDAAVSGGMWRVRRVDANTFEVEYRGKKK